MESKSIINWGYVAGFIDGEGCIRGSGSTEPQITIVQKYPEVLYALKEFLSVDHKVANTARAINPHTGEQMSNNWSIQITGTATVKYVLENILPYLIVKRTAAELVLELCRERVQKYELIKTQHQEAIRLYLEEGLTMTSIARRQNKSLGAISRLLKPYSIPGRC